MTLASAAASGESLYVADGAKAEQGCVGTLAVKPLKSASSAESRTLPAVRSPCKMLPAHTCTAMKALQAMPGCKPVLPLAGGAAAAAVTDQVPQQCLSSMPWASESMLQ